VLVACEQKQADQDKNFMAYSWSQPAMDYSNILPVHWLKSEDLHDFDQFVLKAKTATNLMPDGHRILFSWNVHRSMAYQINGDFLYTKDGAIAGCSSAEGFKPYRSLWWDNGVEVVRQRFDKFFKSYKEIGGALDVFVLDFEQGFSYWHLKHLADKNYPCGLDAYLDAIQNDARFSNWQNQLEFDDLKTLNQWYKNDDHLKWSALVWKHLANYIDIAVYQPMKKYFPNADFSNYGYYYQKSEMDFPTIHGYYRHRYTDGIHVGTHQSREIYGWVNLPSQVRLANKEYPTTPYNAFRFALNKNRAMLLSSQTPVSPWVAYKGFSNGHLYDNDYYQELIFHMLLSGNDYLLYWNPIDQKDFSSVDDKLLDQLIGQVNELIQGRRINFEMTELANWLDDVLLTKVEFDDGEKLWRLTADLAGDKKLSEFIVNTDPARIELEGLEFEFSGMRILSLDNPLSDKGMWLVSSSPN